MLKERAAPPSARSLVLLAIGLFPIHSAVSAPRFNDSGLTHCVNGPTVTSECTGTRQDADHGRDRERPSSRNGYAGFSFQKIDSAGRPLPADATTWTCVKDQVTGLVWEVKEEPGKPRSASDRYYYRDVRKFIDAVNKGRLCGFSDWRLPNKTEADTVASMEFTENGTVMGIDRAYFNDIASVSWTQSCTFEWCYATPFYGGDGDELRRHETDATVRAVRGFPIGNGSSRFRDMYDEVSDDSTGLTWMRCSIGQSWEGSKCVGSAERLTWLQALQKAKSLSDGTGKNWRVPGVKELMSLSNYPNSFPAVDEKFFPQMRADAYWTSSISQNGLPWFVHFALGLHHLGWDGQTADDPIYVKLVRDTQ